MNEKYTYGYNDGWNVENAYIDGIAHILDEYKEQQNVLNQINVDMKTMDLRQIKNQEIDDETLREWYNEDIDSNSLAIRSFENYKQSILSQLQKRDESLNLEKANNRNIYYANLYYLIDIKQETRKQILSSKKDLESKLRNLRIELSQISIQPEYDENRNLINSEYLKEQRHKYDELWLEIRKIEDTIKRLDNMFAEMEFSLEENKLMMRGLNPQERPIYDELVIKNKIKKNPEDPDKDPEDPDKNPEDPDKDPEDPDKNPEDSDKDPEDPDKDPEDPDKDPEDPDKDPNMDNNLTLDEIILKVCGKQAFDDKKSSRYQASKIKVFSKPKKNKLGNSYKVVSILRTIISPIPKLAMKIYGKFLKKEDRLNFDQMYARANGLTDEEVEKILIEYKGDIAQGKRIPKGFNNAVLERVNKYVSERVIKINQTISQKLREIEFYGTIAVKLEERLKSDSSISQDDRERIQKDIKTIYSKSSHSIKDLLSLQKEGSMLQNGSGLHSFEEEVKALNTKLNYAGGRFSSNRKYDPELWAKMGELSHKVEYGQSDEEVVKAYFEQQKLYVENTEEKRSIRDLGSKVSTGKLEYRPFVENLNYGDDPFVKDLITTIMAISSIINLANTISTNIRNKALIDAKNAEISRANQTGMEQQKIISDTRSGDGVISEGIKSDITETQAAQLNMGERGSLDASGWHLGDPNYVASDAANHLASANSVNEYSQILANLNAKLGAGTISKSQYLLQLQSVQSQVHSSYASVVSEFKDAITSYAQSHPQFDYSALIAEINSITSHANSAADMTQFITELYSKAASVADFTNLDLIEQTIFDASTIPGILTLGAVAAKASQETIDEVRKPKQSNWDQDGKFAQLREKIKNGELKDTTEIQNSIEDIISGRVR